MNYNLPNAQFRAVVKREPTNVYAAAGVGAVLAIKSGTLWARWAVALRVQMRG